MTSPGAPSGHSRAVQETVNNLAAGRHVLLCNRIDDLVMFDGESVSLLRAVERIGSAYDVVVRMDAADGLTVVRGADRWQQGGDNRQDPIEQVRGLLEHETLRCLVILDQADILLQEPSIHEAADRRRAAVLALGLARARSHGSLRNTAVLLSVTPSDIPAVVRAGAERIAIVEVGQPTSTERSSFLAANLRHLPALAALPIDQREALLTLYSRMSEGMTLQDLDSMLRYAQNLGISGTDPLSLLRRFQFGERPDYWAAVRTDLPRIAARLRAQVIGQEAAIVAVVNGLAAAALGFSMSGDPHALEAQPRMVLLMLGPTGVGKTELAKALAAALFGDAMAYTRIDMGLFSAEHTVDRLTGAPPGYVGYDRGGELTEAVRRQPQQVVLLDEIEKAHPRVWDPLLSVIDDGRVTDAQGRATYFGETILLMTGNLGSQRMADAGLLGADALTSPVPDYSGLSPAEVEQVYRGAVQDYFRDQIARPEVLGRVLEGVVVFQPLRPQQIRPIVEKELGRAVFAHGPALDLDRDSAVMYVERLLAEPVAASLGGRQIRNSLRSAFLRLASWAVLNGHAEAGVLHLAFEPDGSLRVAADAGPVERIESGAVRTG